MNITPPYLTSPHHTSLAPHYSHSLIYLPIYIYTRQVIPSKHRALILTTRNATHASAHARTQARTARKRAVIMNTYLSSHTRITTRSNTHQHASTRINTHQHASTRINTHQHAATRSTHAQHATLITHHTLHLYSSSIHI